MFRRRRVQLFARRESPFAESSRVGARRPQPRALGLPCRFGFDPVLQVTYRRQVSKRLRGLRLGNAEGVHVRIDEAWYHRPAASLDDSCPLADVPSNDIIRSDGDELAVAHRQGAGHAELLVDGDDVAVDEDEIGRRRRRLRREIGAERDNQEDHRAE